ncbi:MAG: class I SAM-dependent methyltransferase [Planctomycetes bacterium]|nr:class I SAM-dependent methyltransferase [Planctomycetota bacterium]
MTRTIWRLFPRGVPRYLDFACGTGRITSIVGPLAQESYGLDISETMILRARQKCPSTTFIVADATRERLEIAPVDLVTAFRFFGNAQQELRREALAAIWTLLRPGGYLIMNNHKNAGSVRCTLRRLRGETLTQTLDYKGTVEILKDAGFKVIRSYGVGFWLFRAAWVRGGFLDSRLGDVLDSVSLVKGIARFCPDIVFLAQKP